MEPELVEASKKTRRIRVEQEDWRGAEQKEWCRERYKSRERRANIGEKSRAGREVQNYQSEY